MFDYIVCKYPLPAEAAGLEGVELQTKSTPAQFMDTYIISEEGKLYHIEYDIEDRSDPNAEGIKRMQGMMARINERQVLMTEYHGDIEFYGTNDKDELKMVKASFSAGLITGEIVPIKQLSFESLHFSEIFENHPEDSN